MGVLWFDLYYVYKYIIVIHFHVYTFTCVTCFVSPFGVAGWSEK